MTHPCKSWSLGARYGRLLAAIPLLALAVILLFHRTAPVEQVWRGATMGTTYMVKIVRPRGLSASQYRYVEAAIREELETVERQMSTYRPDSEVSRFNASATRAPFPVSPALAKVTRCALKVAALSGGAYDPTVMPLVNLWGFGPEALNHEPREDEWRAARARVGFEHIRVQTNALIRDLPGVQMDLSSVAKGYGADCVARRLAFMGHANVMVEVGGEMVLRGHNRLGNPWRVGIDAPRPGALPGEEIEVVVKAHKAGIATSGDYRNFRVTADGRQVHHLIDPRTGRPVEHALASVTVIAADCMTADALATALFVLGENEGLAVIDRVPDAHAFFVARTPEGTFRNVYSQGFDRYLEEGADVSE